MWILFAVLTVMFWGTSEAIFKKASDNDEHSVIHLLAYNGIIFGLCGFIYMIIVHHGFNFDFKNILTYLPIASIYILSMVLYYHAMKRVKISIVSPIVNSSCVLTVALSIFVLKQEITWLQLIAICVIIFSIIMLSINKKPEDDVKKDKLKPAKIIFILGIIFAIGYFILDGTASFLDESVLELALSESDVIISHSFISFALGVILYIYLKLTDKTYKFNLDKLKLAGSIFETMGEFTYVYALAHGDASIVSPFIASYSAVTIVLSRIFLKEKLKWMQYVFVVLIMVGVVFLSLE